MGHHASCEQSQTADEVMTDRHRAHVADGENLSVVADAVAVRNRAVGSAATDHGAADVHAGEIPARVDLARLLAVPAADIVADRHGAQVAVAGRDRAGKRAEATEEGTG